MNPVRLVFSGQDHRNSVHQNTEVLPWTALTEPPGASSDDALFAKTVFCLNSQTPVECWYRGVFFVEFPVLLGLNGRFGDPAGNRVGLVADGQIAFRGVMGSLPGPRSIAVVFMRRALALPVGILLIGVVGVWADVDHSVHSKMIICGPLIHAA